MTSSTDQPVTQRQEWPNAAQLKREADIRAQVVTNYSKALTLRLKAVELAAQFPSTTDGPMKLAREIYKFLSDTEV